MLKTPLGRLRLIGIIEGASALLLFLIAMPLKYFAGLPEVVFVVGSIHGGLFMLYLAAIADATFARKWPLTRVALAIAASVVPFGPFLLEPSLRREELAASTAGLLVSETTPASPPG